MYEMKPEYYIGIDMIAGGMPRSQGRRVSFYG